MPKPDNRIIPDGPLLHLPAELCGTFGMRSATGEATNLTGSDIALLLILIDLFVHLDTGTNTFRVPQLEITKRFGRVKPDRLQASLERIEANHIWLEGSMNWSPSIVRHSTIATPRSHDNVASASDWVITFDVDLSEAIRKGMSEHVLDLSLGDLRRMSSRYSVALWLRYQVWNMRVGVYPPIHWPLQMPAVGKGVRLTVPVYEVGELLGFEGTMPLSKVLALFSTVDKAYPVVQRELLTAGLDLDIRPMKNGVTGKYSHLRVQVGAIYVDLASVHGLGRWEDRRPQVTPARRKARPTAIGRPKLRAPTTAF